LGLSFPSAKKEMAASEKESRKVFTLLCSSFELRTEAEGQDTIETFYLNMSELKRRVTEEILELDMMEGSISTYEGTKEEKDSRTALIKAAREQLCSEYMHAANAVFEQGGLKDKVFNALLQEEGFKDEVLNSGSGNIYKLGAGNCPYTARLNEITNAFNPKGNENVQGPEKDEEGSVGTLGYFGYLLANFNIEEAPSSVEINVRTDDGIESAEGRIKNIISGSGNIYNSEAENCSHTARLKEDSNAPSLQMEFAYDLSPESHLPLEELREAQNAFVLGDPGVKEEPPDPGLGDPGVKEEPPDPGLGDPGVKKEPPDPGFGDPSVKKEPPDPGLGDPGVKEEPPDPGLGDPGVKEEPPDPGFGCLASDITCTAFAKCGG